MRLPSRSGSTAFALDSCPRARRPRPPRPGPPQPGPAAQPARSPAGGGEGDDRPAGLHRRGRRQRARPRQPGRDDLRRARAGLDHREPGIPPHVAPGPGRDRVKVLEDTDGDGKADKFTVFADGLNIPSGIAVGHGGVWVANSPDILFLQDTDGDGKADTPRGRRHRLRPRRHPRAAQLADLGARRLALRLERRLQPEPTSTHRGKTYDFTCAIFRIHPEDPRLRGLLRGDEQPLGHRLGPRGRGLRQRLRDRPPLAPRPRPATTTARAGPYPPFTWKIESIVDHRHQKAAYCGIHYFDSDAYPARVSRASSSWATSTATASTSTASSATARPTTADAEPDFLTANDAWFMPVVAEDRPRRLPLRPRLVRPLPLLPGRQPRPRRDRPAQGAALPRPLQGHAPARPASTWPKETDDAADRAARRARTSTTARPPSGSCPSGTAPATDAQLEALVLDDEAPRKARMHALWAVIGGGPLDAGVPRGRCSTTTTRASAPGASAPRGTCAGSTPAIRDRIVALARDPSPDVRLQVAIAARKLEGVDPLAGPARRPRRTAATTRSIPHDRLAEPAPAARRPRRPSVRRAASTADRRRRGRPRRAILPRAVERLLGRRDPDPAPVVAPDRRSWPRGRDGRRSRPRRRRSLRGSSPRGPDRRDRRAGARTRSATARSRRPVDPRRARRRARSPSTPRCSRPPGTTPTALRPCRDGSSPSGASPRGRPARRPLERPDRRRRRRDPRRGRRRVLVDRGRTSAEFRGQVLAALGRLDDPRVAEVVLARLPDAGARAPAQGRRAADPAPRLEHGPARRRSARRPIPTRRPEPQPGPQAARAARTPSSSEQVQADLGDRPRGPQPRARAGHRPDARRRSANDPGDPHAGAERLQEASAPSATRSTARGRRSAPRSRSNGRGSYEQLLSNVFDPSLVIGAAYQATTVATADGRVLTGLLVEDSPQRVVLKLQGGKLETVPRDEVEEVKVSPLSLMPEDLEKQLKPQELADLFAFLTLDKPPTDPAARPIPGTPGNLVKPGGNAAEPTEVVQSRLDRRSAKRTLPSKSPIEDVADRAGGEPEAGASGRRPGRRRRGPSCTTGPPGSAGRSRAVRPRLDASSRVAASRWDSDGRRRPRQGSRPALKW